VVVLYDTLVRDLHRAIAAMDEDGVEKRVAAVNHALLVIGELQGVLDFEHGGEPARNLESYYKVIRGLILQGSMHGSRQALEEVIAMVARVRAAWSQIEQHIPTGKPSPLHSGVSNAEPKQVTTHDCSGTSEASSESTGGGWRA
jgi:flagellar protein FliS